MMGAAVGWAQILKSGLVLAIPVPLSRAHRAQRPADLPISPMRHLTPMAARCEISVNPNIARGRVPNEEICGGAIVLLRRGGAGGGRWPLLGQSNDEYVAARVKTDSSASRAGDVARVKPECIAAAPPRDDHVYTAVDKAILDEIIEIPRRGAERVGGLTRGIGIDGQKPSADFEQTRKIAQTGRGVEDVVERAPVDDEIRRAVEMGRQRLVEVVDDFGALIGADIERAHLVDAERVKNGAIGNELLALMAPLPADRRAIDLDRGGVDGVPVTAQDRGKLVHREIRGLPPNEQDI